MVLPAETNDPGHNQQLPREPPLLNKDGIIMSGTWEDLDTLREGKKEKKKQVALRSAWLVIFVGVSP